MAPGPTLPSISVPPSHTTTHPADDSDPSAADLRQKTLRASSFSPAPPPLIVFEPTSPVDANGTDDHDDPFRFDVASTERLADQPPPLPRNPHDEALLRRSPSPTLHSPSSASFPSSFLSPDAGDLERDNRQRHSSRAGHFLSPLHAMGDGAMDGQALPLPPPPLSPSFPAYGGLSESAAVGAAPAGSPFNFQTQYISTSPVKSNIGLRRGHRYKHSSVSAQHQIFQEPPPRPPPVLPASLPVPTPREAWSSMHRDQRARLAWCACHAAVAVFVFLCAATEGGDSLALTALSHLVFFDVGSAAVCVAVDVLGNFEVWRRSTVRHPFGLRRAEVLAGFAMSIFLVFGGFDLLSHDLKDCFEAAAPSLSLAALAGGGPDLLSSSSSSSLPPHRPADHPHHLDIGSHHSHRHRRYVHPGSVDVAALAAFASTLVSAYGFGNHARIRRALLLLGGGGGGSSSRSSGSVGGAGVGDGAKTSVSVSDTWFHALPRALTASVLGASPFHVLTVAVSLVLLMLPLLLVAVPPWLDRLLCLTIAVSMLLLGTRLAVAQGRMLLLSYAGRDRGYEQQQQQQLTVGASSAGTMQHASSVASILDAIAAEPQVARVEDAQFWQVHYGLCLANLRVRMVRSSSSSTGGGNGPSDDDAARRQLRTRIARLIQNRLGEGYGRGTSLRWEVTVQTSMDG
ncbi:cation efflux family protein [Niveomyces insectorum RCEF 264]|uniref:Zinc transporter n=1 Tax=Niveomyces insectorum RCEF 264 TaxID=1081102 RepID=A0A167PS46_9HYPO|nr:cation efflux family protein [Niveomyces insectorum RCEF 264]